MSIERAQWPSPSSLGSPESGVAFWWLGQAGFLIEMGGLRIVIDAYLSDSLAEKYRGKKFPHRRMTNAPIAANDLKNIDWLLCTHGHTDHMDPGTIPPLIAANPQIRVVVPRSEIDRAVERGVPLEKLVPVNDGEKLDLGGVDLVATPAAHEELDRNDKGQARFLGYVLQGGDATLWHSGDTIPFPGLVESVAPQFVDVALLPVNGRDAKRASNGVPGNLTLSEAVRLADDIGADSMIGHHLDMFDFNTLDRDVGEEWLASHKGRVAAELVELGQRYFRAPRTSTKQRKILAVCRGNICRSPLVEGVLAKLLEGRTDWQIESAAIEDWNVGRQPDGRSVAIAQRHGMDISAQSARQICEQDFKTFDIIFGMDAQNIAALHALAPPESTARILRLGDLITTGKRYDIEDPYYFGETEFEKCFSDISKACMNFTNRI